MYYPCSENKGVDQLRGYREADLRLCFRICKKPVFSRRGSYKGVFNVVNISMIFGLSFTRQGFSRKNCEGGFGGPPHL